MALKGELRKSYEDFPASVIDRAIAEWIHDQRDRRILHYKLVDGLTFERIAEIEGMSDRQVKRIVHGLHKRLMEHL